MLKLDENKVYDLSDLTSEEYTDVQQTCGAFTKSRGKYLGYHNKKWLIRNASCNGTAINAKELFYTLENIQVDCTNESVKRIKQMADVFNYNGYKTWDDIQALEKYKDIHVFLRVGIGDKVYINYKKPNKTTITPDKFMELFGDENHIPEVSKIVEEKPQNSYNENNFKQITDSIASLLEYKNEKYGNSALEPLNVFQGKCKVGQRLDDKLARVQNNITLQKNDVADLIGYLFLVCKENDWNNFDEFKD